MRKKKAIVARQEPENASAKFDRLLDAMVKTPALPKKKKRVAVRQVPDEKFDD